jgi:hypothetical protein
MEFGGQFNTAKRMVRQSRIGKVVRALNLRLNVLEEFV